jgi:hypothetical protein
VHAGAPTFTSFESAVNSAVTTEIEISVTDLRSQGNESANTTGFSVEGLTSGSLRLGTDAQSAMPYDAATNALIDTNHKAFWTPAPSDVGGFIDAFSVVAVNEAGSRSATAVQVPVVAIGSAVTSIDYQSFVPPGKDPPMDLKSVVIPESVTTIGDSAFDWALLSSVVIPDSVLSIGDYAFAYAELPSVVIPDSVLSIGEYAFGLNIRMTSVTIGNSVTSIGKEAFVETQLNSVVIPDSVISIGFLAFGSTPSLTSATLGNSVTSIGDAAFEGTSLTSVVIPDSVISIGNSAFHYTRLTSVTIGNSVTSIEGWAFAETPLTSVTIPNPNAVIVSDAFPPTTIVNQVPEPATLLLALAAVPLRVPRG